MSKIKNKNLSIQQHWLDYADALSFGNLHIHSDPTTGLRAIVAVHSLKRGPAIGGCRCLPYDSTEDAIKDALRLAQMMTYKAALMNLPHGGAKAVLIAPPHIQDRTPYFQAFGDFINTLNGCYLTAVDSGTSMSDMDIVATRTPYALCTTPKEGEGGRASAYTALGVYRGIEAAVKYKLGKDSLKDIHVAIQGVGHVGFFLIQLLHEYGAKITLTDIDPEKIEACRAVANVEVVAPQEIYSTGCDVFSPCALGGILNPRTIPKLKASIIVGAANNQLENPSDAATLAKHGILYAPDFAVNAGGLIYAAGSYRKATVEEMHQSTMAIYDTIMEIFKRAEEEQLLTNEIAITIAEERIA